MTAKLICAMIAAAMSLASPVLAQSTQTSAQIVPAPALKSRVNQLIKLLNGSGDYDDIFSPAFREQVPQAKFEAIAAQLRTQGGSATAVSSIDPSSPWNATITVGYEKLLATMFIAVDPTGMHQIVGLRITGAEPRTDSLAKLEADFRKLHGSAGFGIYRLRDDTIAPVAEVNGDVAAPLGSAFKLWILAEAAREIAEHERHWSDVVDIGAHSLPSGILQTWPAHAPVTLQTLATLMISISDNTATDTLLTALGQQRVGAMVRKIGVRAANRTLPVLTTMQAFELKMPARRLLADEWAKDSPAAREKLLAANAAELATTSVDPQLFDGAPLRIDTIEWFASPADMARTLNWLRVHGDATTRAILSVNPGADAAAASHFAYVGFKGGSEPGVITLNYLVKTPAGQWFAVTGNWHDADAAVSEIEFVSLMNRALTLAARQQTP